MLPAQFQPANTGSSDSHLTPGSPESSTASWSRSLPSPRHWVRRLVRTPPPVSRGRDRRPQSDIDGDILPVLVLDFRLGQGALTIEAPIYRLEPAIKVALFEQLPQCANLVGFVAIRHGRVRMLPVAEHPEPLELGLLAHDLFA